MAEDLVITPYCNISVGALQYARTTDTIIETVVI